jgi:hypothetical protein
LPVFWNGNNIISNLGIESRSRLVKWLNAISGKHWVIQVIRARSRYKMDPVLSFFNFLPEKFIFTCRFINFPIIFNEYLKKSGIKFNLAELGG